MIEITSFSQNKQNIHFKNSFGYVQKIEILVYDRFDETLIQSFNIETQPNLEYWISLTEGLGDKKIIFRDSETKQIILTKDYSKKIILIQLWIGKIPDYFWYHYETTKNLKNVDFLFVTDQDIFLDSPNYKVIKTSINDVVDKLSELLGSRIELKNNKKVSDLKASVGDIFYEYIKDYEYFGYYDIDTLFGDFEKYVHPLLGSYDIISVGHETYHNRLSGPFLIMKNTDELRNFYKTEEFIKCFESSEVECYEESIMDKMVKGKFTVKLIYSMNTTSDGKNIYENTWSGGKNFMNGEEIFLYHFYRKNLTKFTKLGNKIYTRYSKELLDDFYWVFGFTENYSKTIEHLMDSIYKYSNRKCVIYSINFDYKTPDNFLTSEQFIFRRIDIEIGELDSRGRDVNIISCKPKLMIDVINMLPNKKFIFIDSDVYLTTASDNISRYFEELENYPLINQHTHDRVFLRNIVDGEEWTSTIDILAKETNTEICVYPRRKTNLMLFDKKSKWFFQEQLEMYKKHKNSQPGIFALHDEDSANVILSKYKLNKSLHLCDIEESSNINMDKFTNTNHPFYMTGLSEFIKLPKHQNDVVCFHGLKSEKQFLNIKKDYGNSVIDCEEILVYYRNNSIFFEKNSFLGNKKIDENVDFIIKNVEGDIVQTLTNQDLSRYWVFYISNIILNEGFYIIEIVKTNSKIKIYNNLLKIKNN